MSNQKNIQESVAQQGSKEAVFADKILEKNKDRKQAYYICFIVYLLWMLAIDLFLDYQLKDTGDRLGCIIVLLGMVGWISSFTNQYFKCYFTLQGENGEQEQNIITVIRQFPFSLTAYQAYIRKQLRFWQRAVFVGTLVISGLGMLIFVWHERYPVFLWETQESGTEIMVWVAGILLLSGFMAMLPEWILYIKLAAVQKYQIKDDKNLRKTTGKTSWSMKEEKKWMLICMEIFLVILLSVLAMVVEEWIHPVSRDGILFVHTPNLWIFAVIIFMDAVRTMYQYWLRRPEDAMQKQELIRWKRRIAIQFCVGLLVFLLPQFYYDTYYEDRVESRHFIQVKSHTWEEVDAYEVYCPAFGQDIQLRVHMSDGSEEKVLWEHTNYSEKYYADYDSDYAYLANLVETFDRLAIPGKLTDPARIENKINRDNEEDWKAWEKIRNSIKGEE